MCILFFYVNPNPVPGSFKLIIASNRDEVYTRPSKAVHQWPANPDVYGGIDLQPGKEGGTWLAINKKGRVGILLNVGRNQEVNAVDETSGRGFHVVDFVSKLDQSREQIFRAIEGSCSVKSQPFKLVTFQIGNESEVPECAVLSHVKETEHPTRVDVIPPGTHGMGNNRPDVTWNKVTFGAERLSQIVADISSWSDRERLVQELVQLLSCRDRHWPDIGISQQLSGKPNAVLECLSSVFVEIPVAKYGTRSQTIILVNYENQVLVHERTLEGLPTDGARWTENRFEFQVEPSSATQNQG